MVHLYLARHGETAENVARILQGHLPGHLTEKGKTQAAQLGNHLLQLHIPFSRIVVSDLQRTLDTAEIVSHYLPLPIVPTPLLRERDWGSVTGISLSEKRIEVFPDDVESIEALFLRALHFIHFILNHYNNENILAIGHGLFNRCILAVAAGKTIQDIPRMQNVEIRELILDSSMISGLPTTDVAADNV